MSQDRLLLLNYFCIWNTFLGCFFCPTFTCFSPMLKRKKEGSISVQMWRFSKKRPFDFELVEYLANSSLGKPLVKMCHFLHSPLSLPFLTVVLPVCWWAVLNCPTVLSLLLVTGEKGKESHYIPLLWCQLSWTLIDIFTATCCIFLMEKL